MWTLIEALDLYLHNFMHSTPATWLAYWITASVSRVMGVPTKVVVECMWFMHRGLGDGGYGGEVKWDSTNSDSESLSTKWLLRITHWTAGFKKSRPGNRPQSSFPWWTTCWVENSTKVRTWIFQQDMKCCSNSENPTHSASGDQATNWIPFKWSL